MGWQDGQGTARVGPEGGAGEVGKDGAMTCTGCNVAHAPHELVEGKCVRCWARQHDALADMSKAIIERLEREVKHLKHLLESKP